MADLPESDMPDANDLVIWQFEEQGGLDVYRVTRGAEILGEFTGRSISSLVFQKAVEHAEPGRAVWSKDDLSLRLLNAQSPLDG